jgi:hypothetical protein
MQPVSKQRLGKHVPAVMNKRATIEGRSFPCGPRRGVTLKTTRLVQFSVESHPVKRRLGGLCEMAASLGPS